MKKLLIVSLISLVTTNCNYTTVNKTTSVEVNRLAMARMVDSRTIEQVDEAIVQAASYEVVEDEVNINVENNIEEEIIETKIYRERDYIEQIIYEVSCTYDFPELLLQGIIYAESNFDPNIIGPDTHLGNAHGLMQLLPSTAESLGVTDIFDPYQNVDAGTRYMMYLADMYRDDVYYDHLGNILHPYEMAIMAYNWGYGNLNNHLYMHGVVVIDENSEYGIPSETYNYLLKIRNYCEEGKLSYEL